MKTNPPTSTDFWTAAPELRSLEVPPAPSAPPVLERLGTSPFPKNQFPFLGFLASVYDHVAETISPLKDEQK